jgi:hypothetical protein
VLWKMVAFYGKRGTKKTEVGNGKVNRVPVWVSIGKSHS